MIELNLLNERAIIGIDSNIMHFTVDGDGLTDLGFAHDPYFKIFDGHDFDHSKNRTRISMYRPEYVIHNRDIWKLNEKELDELIRLVTGVTSTYIPTWEYIQMEAVFEGGQSSSFTKEDKYKIEHCTIPDYKNIDFSEKDYRKHGGLIKSWKKKK